jgi:hypothetical protein
MKLVNNIGLFASMNCIPRICSNSILSHLHAICFIYLHYCCYNLKHINFAQHSFSLLGIQNGQPQILVNFTCGLSSSSRDRQTKSIMWRIGQSSCCLLQGSNWSMSSSHLQMCSSWLFHEGCFKSYFFYLLEECCGCLSFFSCSFALSCHGKVEFVAMDCSCNVSLKKSKNLELVLDLVLEPSQIKV